MRRLSYNHRPTPYRKRTSRQLPTKPGIYWWSTWKALVEVVKRGSALYVTPPARTAVEVRISPRIAGEFTWVSPSTI